MAAMMVNRGGLGRFRCRRCQDGRVVRITLGKESELLACSLIPVKVQHEPSAKKYQSQCQEPTLSSENRIFE